MTVLVTKLTEEVDNRYLRRIDEAVYDIKPGVSSTILKFTTLTLRHLETLQG